MSASWWRLLKARTSRRGLRNTWHAVELQALMLRHATLRKIANALLMKAQKWLRRDRLVGMPYRYNIDPTNVCNLRCPLCPTGLGTLQRVRGMMSLEDYQRIIDQIAHYACLLELYNWGEPFLHPQIFDMIRYASERGIFVRLSSNLNHFDRRMAQRTVDSHLDALIVSLDGATEATYQMYRRGGQLSRVVENVRLLTEAKKQARSRMPHVTLRMLVNRYNEREIDDVRQMAAELGAELFTIGTLFVNTKEQAEEWLPQDERLSYYDYSSESVQNVWNCADLWEAMVINWDGGISPCCWVQSAEHDFDNALSKPLKDIWNNPAYVSARRVFSARGPRPSSQKTICDVCQGHPEYLNY